jgi:hypothetical protein
VCLLVQFIRSPLLVLFPGSLHTIDSVTGNTTHKKKTCMSKSWGSKCQEWEEKITLRKQNKNISKWKKKKIRTRRHYIYIPHRAIHLNRFLSDSGFFHLRRIIQFFIYLFFWNFRLVDRFSLKETNKT